MNIVDRMAAEINERRISKTYKEIARLKTDRDKLEVKLKDTQDRLKRKQEDLTKATEPRSKKSIENDMYILHQTIQSRERDIRNTDKKIDWLLTSQKPAAIPPKPEPETPAEKPTSEKPAEEPLSQTALDKMRDEILKSVKDYIGDRPKQVKEPEKLAEKPVAPKPTVPSAKQKENMTHAVQGLIQLRKPKDLAILAVKKVVKDSPDINLDDLTSKALELINLDPEALRKNK